MPADHRSATTRDRILDGALSLIAERGLAAVTNRNLARASQVSLGSLTYHFTSQEQILRESLLRFVEREAERLLVVAERLRASGDAAASADEVQRLLSQESATRLAKLELYLYAARQPSCRVLHGLLGERVRGRASVRWRPAVEAHRPCDTA